MVEKLSLLVQAVLAGLGMCSGVIACASGLAAAGLFLASGQEEFRQDSINRAMGAGFVVGAIAGMMTMSSVLATLVVL